MTPSPHPSPTPEAVRTAVMFLARVTPRGPDEADDLYRTIQSLSQFLSTPVQPR